MLYLKKMLQSMRIIGLLKDLISNWKLSIGPIFNNTLLATKFNYSFHKFYRLISKKGS